tara:strand:+ start:305 stop:646 length:342 start_codon:yes stop_codon:yes gene_type:complete
MNNLNIQLNKTTILKVEVAKSKQEEYSHNDVFNISTYKNDSLELLYTVVSEHDLNILEVIQQALLNVNKSLVIQIEYDYPMIKHCEQIIKQLIAILKNKHFKSICKNQLIAEY